MNKPNKHVYLKARQAEEFRRRLKVLIYIEIAAAVLILIMVMAWLTR